MRKITIGEKELTLRATPVALLYYKQEFGSDLIADLPKLVNVEKLNEGDISGVDYVGLLQLVFAMNKAANVGKNFPGFDQWLDSLGNVDFADTVWIDEATNEAINGFFRSSQSAPAK